MSLKDGAISATPVMMTVTFEPLYYLDVWSETSLNLCSFLMLLNRYDLPF